jgi:hypothetical protein
VTDPVLTSATVASNGDVTADISIPSNTTNNDLILQLKPNPFEAGLSLLTSQKFLADSDNVQNFAITAIQHAAPGQVVSGVQFYVEPTGSGGTAREFQPQNNTSTQFSIKTPAAGVVNVLAEWQSANGQAIYGSMSIPVEAKTQTQPCSNYKSKASGDCIELLDGNVLEKAWHNGQWTWHCLLGPASALCANRGLAAQSAAARASAASSCAGLCWFLGLFGLHWSDPPLQKAAQSASQQPTQDEKVRAASANGAPPGVMADPSANVGGSDGGAQCVTKPPCPAAINLNLNGNVVAAGSGNVVAAGSGNVVAAGSGNVVAAGSGNIIGAGSGNVVAAGSGN